MWGHGLPNEGRFLGLLYNGFSEHLIVGFSRTLETRHVIEELYFRHNSSPEYTRITGFGNAMSLRDPLSCLASPCILFRVCRLNPGGGYDWDSVCSFDLITKKKSTLLSADSMPRFDDCTRAWISSLISSNAEGNVLIVIVALQRTEEATGLSRVDHSLCELKVSDLSIRKLTALSSPFA